MPASPEGIARDPQPSRRDAAAAVAASVAAARHPGAGQGASSGQAGGTVTVACKVPGGFHLVLHVMEKVAEPVMGGGWKEVERSRPHGRRYTVHGAAFRVDKAPGHAIIGGYGLTHGIPAEFFAEWLAQNADHDAVRNGLIFAVARPDDAGSEALSRSGVASGLEPVSPSKLPRGIATATDRPL